MFQIIKPGTTFDFIAKRGTAAIVSGFFLLGAIGVLVGIGPNYGIDFRGGSDIILTFSEGVTAEQVREAAGVAGFPDASVQSFGDGSRNQFMVQTRAVSVVDEDLSEQIAEAIDAASPLAEQDGEKLWQWSSEQPDRLDFTLKNNAEPDVLSEAIKAVGLNKVDIEVVGTAQDKRYAARFEDLSSRVRTGFAKALPKGFDPDTGLERLETVGARVGNQLREDGIAAMLISLLAILVYIAVRFDIRYAPGAVAALAHDVLFSVGFLTVLQVEFNLPILAALLTIVGYSLNDTIVVFDRIRENYTAGRGGSNLREIINTSVNETLSRTIITSLTTFLAVFIIWMLGSGLIKDFALTLIVGVVVGTYSSIFIASPILLSMDTWLRQRQEARDLSASLEKKTGGA
ncbi:MAG: protein translocase subunit SecF [Myxococcota bacterium]